MPRFGKNNFHQLLLSVFEMNYTVNFPFKVCNTDCIMPGFDKQFIFNNFYMVV